MTFTGGVVLDGKLSPSFGLKITGGHAHCEPRLNSFIASVLPVDGLDFHFDLAIAGRRITVSASKDRQPRSWTCRPPFHRRHPGQ